MLKDTKTQLENHRLMATCYLRSADVYKMLGNREMYLAKMIDYEREMREVVRCQIALKKAGVR